MTGLSPTTAQRMERAAAYDHVIGELRKNAAEGLGVSLHEFRSYDTLSLRVCIGQHMRSPTTLIKNQATLVQARVAQFHLHHYANGIF
jgi:hypothetical protein